MGIRKRPAGTVQVEELSLSGWADTTDDGGAQPPPAGPPPEQSDRGAWWRTHGARIAAVAGVVIVLGGIVAVTAGSSPDDAAPATDPTTATTAPLPTTSPRPVHTDAPTTSGSTSFERQPDLRVLVNTVPDGYEVTGATADGGGGPVESPEGAGSYQLFVGDGATWSTGQWLLVAAGEPDFGFGYNFQFTRPPTDTTVNGMPASTGRGTVGDELTMVRDEREMVVVAGRGLPMGATTSIAASVSTEGGVLSLAASAVPAGLTLHPVHDPRQWFLGWTSGAGGVVGYQSTDGTTYIQVAVSALDPADTTLVDAAFFLDDLRYAVVRGEEALAGTYGWSGDWPVRVVLWEEGERRFTVTTFGRSTIDDALTFAASVMTPDDPIWRDRRWDDALDDARQCCTTSDDLDPVTVEQAAVGNAAWTVDASVYGDQLQWTFWSHRNGFGDSATISAPMLEVGTSYVGWEQAEMYVGVLAIVDQSMPGAVLRLSLSGSDPRTVEVPLHAVAASDELAPYLIGATVLPWIDGGFTAELVATDGTVIATRTDADLP